MGLKMNIAKTKVMVVDNTPLNVNNVLIENVQGYVYLGQHYSLKEKNQDKAIQRRIMAAQKKHRTNLRPHRPKWKEVCSTSHTKIERLKWVRERTKVIDIINSEEK